MQELLASCPNGHSLKISGLAAGAKRCDRFAVRSLPSIPELNYESPTLCSKLTFAGVYFCGGQRRKVSVADRKKENDKLWASIWLLYAAMILLFASLFILCYRSLK
jgi:hypothetical protein